MFHPIAPSGLQLALGFLAILLFAVAVAEKRIRTKGSTGSTGRSSVSLGGIALQALAFGIAGTGPITPRASSFAPVPLCLSLIVAVSGLGAVLLFRSSARTLGQNWSLVARTRAEHTLVTSGPFARVRHPIYLAMLLLLFAVAIGFGHLVSLALALPMFLAGTAIRIREEERLLIDQFGDEYRRYARTTPAFIPRLP